jgi:long-subunit acyl-CoA synthetase (AMP-forming)
VAEELFLGIGSHIGYWQGSPKALLDDVVALRPTVFVGVPRIFDRLYSGVTDKVPSPLVETTSMEVTHFEARCAYVHIPILKMIPSYASTHIFENHTLYLPTPAQNIICGCTSWRVCSLMLKSLQSFKCTSCLQVSGSSFFKRTLFDGGFFLKEVFLHFGICNVPGVDDLIFNPVKQRLGGRVRVVLSGGAPIAKHVEHFLKVTMCCPVTQVWIIFWLCSA